MAIAREIQEEIERHVRTALNRLERGDIYVKHAHHHKRYGKDPVPFEAGAGLGMCYDYIVAECWKNEVAAGRGTEGQTFTLLTGCTVKLYSTIQGAWDEAKNSTGNVAIFVCPGDAGPLSITDDNGFTAFTIRIEGVGDRSVIRSLSATGGNREVILADVKLQPTPGTAPISKSATSTLRMHRVRVTGTVTPAISEGSLHATDCSFEVNQSSAFALDLANNVYYSVLRDCSFNDRVRPGSETYLLNPAFHLGASGYAVDTSGYPAPIRVSGGYARSGGSPFTAYFRASHSVQIEGFEANVGAQSAAIEFISSPHTNVRHRVVGNAWQVVLGIQNSAGYECRNLVYVGNRHLVDYTFPNPPEELWPTIVSGGPFYDCVFAGNSPPHAKYNITSGSGNIIDGVEYGSGAPSHEAPEGRLYWDRTNNVMYVNTDGAATWTVLGPGGGGGGGGPHTHPHTDITTSGMKQTLVLTAAAGSPSGTSGASGPTKVSFATNNRDVWVLDFSNGTSVTYAFWDIIMPDNWDGGNLTATFHWFANDATTNGVRWGIAAVATGDGEVLDAAFGTAAEVTDNNGGTANQLRVSPTTTGFAPGGTPAAGKTVTFRVYRDPTHADDTLAANARLAKVVLEYGVTSLST